jgi:coenzyme PQQ synthesis protein D (PqqD)
VTGFEQAATTLNEDAMNPQSRRDFLLAQHVGHELVIYDERTHEAHRLSRTAALVWETADGSRDVHDVAARLRDSLRTADPPADPIDDAASESLVLLALQELDRTGLLAQKLPALGESISRREMLGVAAALLPVIASIAAPTPAMAQSIPQGACTYTVTSSPPAPISGNGGTVNVLVTTNSPGCAWTPTSMSSFVTLGPPPFGGFRGTTTASFTFAQNTTGQPRDGIIRITYPAGSVRPFDELRIRQDPILGTGVIQATLRWDTTADIDLHVIEPSGAEVYYASPKGPTAVLDRDDTDGEGPENIFVQTPVAGDYQFFIVHFSGVVPTTSTITVTFGTQTRTITRTTTAVNTSLGHRVATVNIATGITETTGTRPAADERPGGLRTKPR